jgi:hypothetical protein
MDKILTWKANLKICKANKGFTNRSFHGSYILEGHFAMDQCIQFQCLLDLKRYICTDILLFQRYL